MRVFQKKARQFSHVNAFHAYTMVTSELFAAMVVQVSDGMFEHQINQTISGRKINWG